jgi:esterase/lipase superfamily enzyme
MAIAVILSAIILQLIPIISLCVVAQSTPLPPKSESGQPTPSVTPVGSPSRKSPQEAAGANRQSDLVSSVSELIALLKKQADSHTKDAWDKFATISTFMSSVIIALMGLYFTYSYNRAESARRELSEARQHQINELEVVAKFMPYLTGNDENGKRTSITTIKALAGVQLAAAMAELHPSPGTAEGLEAIAQSSTTSGQDRMIAATAANKIRDSLPAIRVFYATDRARISNGKVSYGTERGQLSLGFASVTIPESHQIGTLEQPKIYKFEFKSDPSRHIALREVSSSTEAAYFAELASTVAQSSINDLLVFVHGFNISFEHAVRRTAQIAYDLALPFPVAAFSWPSRGTVTAYMQDADSASYAAPHFVEFVEKAISSANIGRVHVMASDMGARLVVDAMVRLSSNQGDMGSKIQNVIMIAPDVDRDWFLANAKAITTLVRQTTIYVSSEDLGLRAATAIHHFPRLGMAPIKELSKLGIDVIEVAGDAGYFNPGARSVLSDVFALLQYGARAEQRTGLQSVVTPEGRYWKLA